MSNKSLRLIAINEDLRAIAAQVEGLQLEAGLHNLDTLSVLLKLAQEEAISRMKGQPAVPTEYRTLTLQ